MHKMADLDLNGLRCPLGKAPLTLTKESLICTKCGVEYPVNDGIPSLLLENALLPEHIASINELPCQKEKSK
jgi:uncharacterized protein YbaR (Trm112 family)